MAAAAIFWPAAGKPDVNKLQTIIIFLFALGCLLTIVLTPLCIRLAFRMGLVDKPGDRKIHKTPIPRIGGVAIFGALAVGAGIAMLVSSRLHGAIVRQFEFIEALGIGTALVFAVGLYDDYKGAGVVQRLAVEIGAALIVIYMGDVRIDNLGMPWAGTVPLGPLSVPVTLLWIVGVTNALNLIDGLDGLAGGVAFIATFGLFVVAVVNNQTVAMASLALVAGALLGFLRYNFHPARVFLGDSGALTLGFLLASVSLYCSLKRSASMALIIPMQMLAVPVFDTLYAMARRSLNSWLFHRRPTMEIVKSMFRADRKHFHHVLLDNGFSHRSAVLVIYGLSFVLAVFGILSALTLSDWISTVFILVGVSGFLLVHRASQWLFGRRVGAPSMAENPEVPEVIAPPAPPVPPAVAKPPAAHDIN